MRDLSQTVDDGRSAGPQSDLRRYDDGAASAAKAVLHAIRSAIQAGVRRCYRRDRRPR